eukprot:SAG25_NODE_232_length_11380_cov_15.425583_11_plen_60_part_00
MLLSPRRAAQPAGRPGAVPVPVPRCREPGARRQSSILVMGDRDLKESLSSAAKDLHSFD